MTKNTTKTQNEKVAAQLIAQANKIGRPVIGDGVVYRPTTKQAIAREEKFFAARARKIAAARAINARKGFSVRALRLKAKMAKAKLAAKAKTTRAA